MPGDQGRSLDALDRSVPDTYSNLCHLPTNEFVLKPCYGNKGGLGPLIYLVGDSHAAQWVPALEAISPTNFARFRFITKSSCPYVSLKFNKNCEKWIENFTEDIISNKPTLVIFSSMTNARYITPLNEETYSKLWLKNFHLLSTRIKQSTQIALIVDTAYSSFDSSECLLSHRELDCDFSFRQTRLTQLLAEYALAHGISYLNFNTKLCPEMRCISGDSQINYYRDAHHVSVSLSTRFGALMKENLKDILRM